jgi:hypothetical protein
MHGRNEIETGGGNRQAMILSELNTVITSLGLPIETGIFSGTAPDEYAVITPLVDYFEVHADNFPRFEVQEARITLYTKGNYLLRRHQLSGKLLAADFVITGRKYSGYDDETEYHGYTADVVKAYPYGG